MMVYYNLLNDIAEATCGFTLKASRLTVQPVNWLASRGVAWDMGEVERAGKHLRVMMGTLKSVYLSRFTDAVKIIPTKHNKLNNTVDKFSRAKPSDNVAEPIEDAKEDDDDDADDVVVGEADVCRPADRQIALPPVLDLSDDDDDVVVAKGLRAKMTVTSKMNSATTTSDTTFTHEALATSSTLALDQLVNHGMLGTAFTSRTTSAPRSQTLCTSTPGNGNTFAQKKRSTRSSRLLQPMQHRRRVNTERCRRSRKHSARSRNCVRSCG